MACFYYPKTNAPATYPEYMVVPYDHSGCSHWHCQPAYDPYGNSSPTSTDMHKDSSDDGYRKMRRKKLNRYASRMAGRPDSSGSGSGSKERARRQAHGGHCPMDGPPTDGQLHQQRQARRTRSMDTRRTGNKMRSNRRGWSQGRGCDMGGSSLESSDTSLAPRCGGCDSSNRTVIQKNVNFNIDFQVNRSGPSRAGGAGPNSAAGNKPGSAGRAETADSALAGPGKRDGDAANDNSAADAGVMSKSRKEDTDGDKKGNSDKTGAAAKEDGADDGEKGGKKGKGDKKGGKGGKGKKGKGKKGKKGKGAAAADKAGAGDSIGSEAKKKEGFIWSWGYDDPYKANTGFTMPAYGPTRLTHSKLPLPSLRPLFRINRTGPGEFLDVQPICKSPLQKDDVKEKPSAAAGKKGNKGKGKKGKKGKGGKGKKGKGKKK